MTDISAQIKQVGMEAGPLKGATPLKGGVAALPTTSAGRDFGDSGS